GPPGGPEYGGAGEGRRSGSWPRPARSYAGGARGFPDGYRGAALAIPGPERRQGNAQCGAVEQGLGTGVPRRRAVPARMGLAPAAQARVQPRRPDNNQDDAGNWLYARRRVGLAGCGAKRLVGGQALPRARLRPARWRAVTGNSAARAL